METAPGLAPGKSRVAACRLDDFGIAVAQREEPQRNRRTDVRQNHGWQNHDFAPQ